MKDGNGGGGGCGGDGDGDGSDVGGMHRQNEPTLEWMNKPFCIQPLYG